jgi:hypothetical protein
MQPMTVLAAIRRIVASDDESFWPHLTSGAGALFVAFVLGMVGNFLAQYALERRRESSARRAMREGLIAEAIDNLQIFDAYEKTFRQGLQDVESGARVIRWPDASLRTAVLEACLDPSSLALLSAAEQGKVTLLSGQIASVRADMAEAHDTLSRLPQRRGHYYRRFLDYDMPGVGANLVDMLCSLLTEQDRFASGHAAELATRVLAATIDNGASPDRMWRSSDFRRSADPGLPGGVALVWRNDDLTVGSDFGTKLVELLPPNDFDRVGAERPRWWQSERLAKRKLERKRSSALERLSRRSPRVPRSSRSDGEPNADARTIRPTADTLASGEANAGTRNGTAVN